MDRISRKARRGIMAKVRNKDTDIERQLRKLLWDNKLRYRKHYKVVGRPDIAFPGYKIAIFCDGDFWHGKNFAREGKKYNDFWYEKILQNIKRDREVTNTLEDKGWVVLRFWKEEIKREPSSCLAAVLNAVTKCRVGTLLCSK